MSELQDLITHNVKVFMAIRGMDRRGDLGTVLGITSDAAYNKLNGKRDWTLADIAKMAEYFQFPELAFVNQGDPGTAVASGDKSGYVYSTRRRSALILTMPHVTRPARQDSRPCPVIPIRMVTNRPIGSPSRRYQMTPNVHASERVNYA